MVEICSICGLPKDICVCGEISKEQQKILVRRQIRRYRKSMTIIDGLDSKEVNLKKLAKKMKNFCACGGTAKNGQILLQGDQREKVHRFLIQAGYPEENIEVQ
ncbi:MAG: translation initiation factor [Candidatus Bathyarchaeota archaeon]|nr:translation initiation factor [Candidatus Bathyarchaeota archaeon]